MTMGGVCEILIPHLVCNDLLYKSPCPPPFATYEEFSVHARNQNITDIEISVIAQNCRFSTLSLITPSVSGPILSTSYYPKTTPAEEILTTENTTIDSTTSFVDDTTVDISIPYDESTVTTETQYTLIICIVVTMLIFVCVLTIILILRRRRKKGKYELGTTIHQNQKVSDVNDAMDKLLHPQGFIEDKLNWRQERKRLDQSALAKEFELMIDK